MEAKAVYPYEYEGEIHPVEFRYSFQKDCSGNYPINAAACRNTKAFESFVFHICGQYPGRLQLNDFIESLKK